MNPAVVTRGYGGSASGRGGVITAPEGDEEKIDIPPGYEVWRSGSDADAAALMGDEAVLYLREGIPLAVDADRARGIGAVTRLFSPTHVILDDAFQRISLPKDLDILLLDARRPFGSEALLPAGTLREPPSAVSRAGAIVFTRAEGEETTTVSAGIASGKAATVGTTATAVEEDTTAMTTGGTTAGTKVSTAASHTRAAGTTTAGSNDNHSKPSRSKAAAKRSG